MKLVTIPQSLGVFPPDLQDDHVQARTYKLSIDKGAISRVIRDLNDHPSG